jgi:prepilin-type N-terminal cleavage/methylation domain-containing protein
LIGKLGDEGGFSLVEMLVVMVIMSIVAGGIVKLFTTGINADANQNHRFQAQQDGRVALDRLRRDIHAACSISTPLTYNTAVASVTLYSKQAAVPPAASTCAASPILPVTYCTILVAAVAGPPSVAAHYTLYRRSNAATCAATDQPVADFLTTTTSGLIFDYLPPNSYVTTLGGGTGSAAITTVDSSSTLPRLHVDMTLNQVPSKPGAYHVVDDIALRNGPRACATGTPSC